MRVRCDVGAVQPCLAVDYSDERVGDVGFSLSDRLDFRTCQHDAGFKFLNDLIFKSGPSVRRNGAEQGEPSRTSYWLGAGAFP